MSGKSADNVYGFRTGFLIFCACVSTVFALASFAIWPVFLVVLAPEWGLSNTETGWISGAYFVGYVLATPVLVGLTDSIDAKRVFIGGSLTTAIGSAGFAFLPTIFGLRLFAGGCRGGSCRHLHAWTAGAECPP